jgi:hypothetical protein
MNSPNLQQRIYLAKALNENTDTLFDHPQMNEEEMGEESITEGVRRMRRLRRAHVSGKASRKTTDAYDKELSKLSASRLRRGGARKQTIRAFFTDKPTTPAADKAYERFTKGAMQKANAKGKKIFEDMDLDEGSYVHSKGQLKKSIKGSKRNIVKAMKKGDKKEASFWMQNKKDAEEQLKEATRSKYLKVYGKHKVGQDDSNLETASLKRDMAILRRGGATPEQMKGAVNARGRYRRLEKPDPSFNPYEGAMAAYRFANMASRSKEAGKKSPRK